MTTAEPKPNRKEAIFTAAVHCFNENGYYKTSMDTIAERAGITKRGLYYHFKSKDELFIQLFNYMNEKYLETIPAVAARVSDPEERLRVFCKIATDFLAQNRDFLKFSQEFLSISVRKPEICKVMTSHYRKQVQKVSKTIEDGIAGGTFSATDTEKAARAIVLITMGAFNVYFSLNSDYDLVEQHIFDIGLIIKGLKKQHPDDADAGLTDPISYT